MIEYCLNNVDEETRRLLRDATGATESPCLEHCGICRAEPFAVVDGRMRRLDDHEALFEDAGGGGARGDGTGGDRRTGTDRRTEIDRRTGTDRRTGVDR